MKELDRTSLPMNWTNLHCLMEILPKTLYAYSKVRWIQGWEVQGEQLITAEVRSPAMVSMHTKITYSSLSSRPEHGKAGKVLRGNTT